MAPRMFHQGHYNIIASQISEAIEKHRYKNSEISEPYHNIRSAETTRPLVDLALSLAKRFLKDNPDFDPIKFLRACSPNNDLFPITELWED